ncbi:sugar transferase [Mucilaginibacter sp. HD30]
MAYRYSKYLPAFAFICDLLLLNIALYPLCDSIRYIEQVPSNFLIIANLLWVLLAPIFRIYKFSRPLFLKDSFNKFFQALLLHVAGFASYIYVSDQYHAVDSRQITITYCIFILLVFFHRNALSAGLNYIRRLGYNCRNILIIGDESISNRLSEHFNNHPEYGYDMIDNAFGEDINNYSDSEIEERLLQKNPDEIFVCYQQIDEHFLSFLISFGARYAIRIKQVSDLILTNNYARIVNYDNLPVLQVKHEFNVRKSVKIAKRSFDILFSSVLMIAFSPIYVIIYLITKFSSEGPVYYKQERVGLNGRPFKIIKFRSMYVDAERHGPQLATDNDPRITRWGRIMRKTRLDELPQFWNVLKGDMSIVGPRPERLHYVEKITERKPQYEQLLAIKPGITSIGQVHYGYAENIDQMCERMHYDLLYLQDISLNSDVKLILRTVKVMVQGKGK